MRFDITERWLMDSGGWQAMKPARALWQGGGVLSVEFDGVRLRGQVRGAGKVFASGLLIKTRTDVTNLCSCPEARRSGALCPHSLALGLAWVHGGAGKQTPAAASSAPAAQKPAAPVKNEPPPPAKAVRAQGALSFRLPPNFFDGVKRQRLVLSVIENKSEPPSADDEPFLKWLAAVKQTSVPPNVSLSEPGPILGVLSALADHPRVTVGSAPLAVSSVPFRWPLELKMGADGAAELRLLPPPNAQWAWPTHEHAPVWVFTQSGGQNVLSVCHLGAFSRLFQNGPGRWVSQPMRWLAQHLGELSDVFEIEPPDDDATGPDLRRLHVEVPEPQFVLELEGTLARVTARLRCLYPGQTEPIGAGQPSVVAFPLPDPARPLVFHARNEAAELRALSRLENAGFSGDLKQHEALEMRGEAAILQFYAGNLPRLEKEWSVRLSERLRSELQRVERIAPRWSPVAEGSDWLAFDVQFAGEAGTRMSHAEVQRLLQGGQGHRRLPNGKIAVIGLEEAADFEEVLRDVRPAQESGHFRVNRSQAAYLASVFGGGPEPDGKRGEISLISHAPSHLQEILRDYQKTGVTWLAGHAGENLGGILADEMGLGKTLQSLAVIGALRKKDPAKPCLVVCPKSLIGNWRDEAARFVPEVDVLAVRSGERTRELGRLASAGLVLTSYQLLARDVEHYAAVEWGGIFLDEASFIRNKDTLAAKALRRLNAGCRFALTGTPIENSVRDLWSIMNFAVPGYLGTADDFKDRYETPVAAGDAKALARLRRRMSPFWLRRLKQDVAKDLPAKLEKVVKCELSDWQRELYAKILREGTAKTDEARRTRNAGQLRMSVLTALLRMRQTCCDPRLLGMAEDEPPGDISGKWAALVELLEEIRDGGHSVLIFSQFAKMLRLLHGAAEEVGLGFCHLDGSTADRDAEVRSFRENPDKRVFFISLKAGGFGLNLTKADTVIHFDPWWNPAVEAQATDRAHRLGQAKPVTVYKLVAEGTVEEKILALQAKKRGVMEAALDDSAPLMGGLTDGELEELLRA